MSAAAFASWLENFLDQQKQITNAGKSADYAAKANPQMLKDIGIHPDEWANLGAADKANAFRGWGMAQSLRRQQAETAQLAAGETFRNALQRATAGNPAADQMGSSPTMQMLAPDLAARLQQMGRHRMADPEEMVQIGIESGVDPGRMATLGEALARIKTASRERAPKSAPLPFSSPERANVGIYSPDTGAFQILPDAKAEAEAANKDGTIEIPDQTDPVYGPRIRIPLSVAKRDYPHLLKGLTPPAAAGEGKSLDKATAAALLKEAGGDKNKARQLAKDRGYLIQ